MFPRPFVRPAQRPRAQLFATDSRRGHLRIPAEPSLPVFHFGHAKALQQPKLIYPNCTLVVGGSVVAHPEHTDHDLRTFGAQRVTVQSATMN